MKLTLDFPVKLELRLLEEEEHVGSFRCDMDITIEGYLSSVVAHVASVWFERRTWSTFCESSVGEGNSIFLEDMSKVFTLTINRSEGEIFLSLKYVKKSIGRGATMISYDEKISQDDLDHITNAFSNFYISNFPLDVEGGVKQFGQ